MTKDTKLSELVINKLTTAQYNGIATKDPNQLYVVTDAPGFEESLTNCITKISQDIKLELNNGTLTLKAGSKVYIPDGFEADGTTPKFEIYTISEDVSHTISSSGTLPKMLFYRKTSNSINCYWTISDCYSGTTTPSASYYIYYNTTTNTIRFCLDGTVANNEVVSLPISIISLTNGITTSIDQVFNGFGYVGSTAFALPGVKGLIPNGRNKDGSLRNIEFTVDKVVTRTITWNNSGGQELFIGKYAINRGLEFISTGHIGQIYQQENEPSLVRYNIWYKPSENKVYRCDLDSNSNLIWKDNYPCYIGQWFTSGSSPYPITKLTTKLPFRAVDYNDITKFNKLDVIDGTLAWDGKTCFLNNNSLIRIKDRVNKSSTAPTSNSNSGVAFYGTDSVQTGEMIQEFNTNGNQYLRLGLRRQVSGTWKYGFIRAVLSSAGVDSFEASAGVKSSIVNWGMPDYSRSFTISSGYTTTTDGYFEGVCNSQGNYKITIGGVVMVDRGYSNTQVGFPFAIAVPKGTNITFASIQIPKFIPCKGV